MTYAEKDLGLGNKTHILFQSGRVKFKSETEWEGEQGVVGAVETKSVLFLTKKRLRFVSDTKGSFPIRPFGGFGVGCPEERREIDLCGTKECRT